MPIPKPQSGESRKRFMSRCLGDSTMIDEYDSNQRMAVCATAYEDSKQEDNKEEIRRDVFSTQREAEERAEEIGCSGTHSHTEDGKTIYMPCASHDAYIAAEGRNVSGYYDDDDDKKKPKKPKKKEECSCSETKDYETQIQFKADIKMPMDDEEKEEGVFQMLLF